MKLSTYNGVTRAVRCESRPWRAQCAVAGKNYHLGNFETEPEAARAYDNAVFHLREFGFSPSGELNFPKEYELTPPPMTETTRRVILDCVKRGGAPDTEKLPRVIARLLPHLRQIAKALPDLEHAVAGRPEAQDTASVTNDEQRTTTTSQN